MRAGPPSEVTVEQVLVELLAAGSRLRLDLFLGDPRRDPVERRALLQHRLRLGLLPAGVALGARRVELAVLDQMRGGDQRCGAGVDAADMAEQQIARVDRLPAYLRIEVEAARR